MTTEQRLERLERKSTCLLAWCLALSFLLAVALWQTLLPKEMLPEARTVPSADNSGVVEAKELALKDSKGKRRFIVRQLNPDLQDVAMFDSDGLTRFQLAVQTATAGWALSDHDGAARMSAVAKKEAAELILRHPSGEPAILITAHFDRGPSIFLLDKDGKVIWKAPKD